MARPRQTDAAVAVEPDAADDIALANLLALEEADGSARTAVLVHQYLLTHQPNRERLRLDFLLRDLQGLTWLVRWPSGSMKWETTVGLAARGFTVPAHAIIEHAAFVDPLMAKEVAALLERR